MNGVSRLRARLRLRSRFHDPVRVKHDAELRWWLEHWDPVLRAGGFSPGDAPAFLEGEPIANTYEGRRWQQARAEVRRLARDAGVADPSFFEGKVVVDIGPGPLGFPDACPARVSIGVEPLAEQYAAAGLLLPNSSAIYLAAGAEQIPLLTASADAVIARNSLDHVDDPELALAEMCRILREGGTLILMFDVGHAPTATEPHSLTVERVRAAITGLQVTRQEITDESFGAGAGARCATIVAHRT